MVDKIEKPSGVAVGISRATKLPPAEGANYFHFTVLGPEVQMLVGTVNLLHLHEAKLTDSRETLEAEITHRFLLSPLGFQALKSQMDMIAASVQPVAGITSGAKAK